MPAAAVFPGDTDPAAFFQAHGADALSAILQRAEPLAKVVINAFLDDGPWQLQHPGEQLTAMRSAAAVIARALPPHAVSRIREITRGRPLATVDEDLAVGIGPDLLLIARVLQPEAICQIVQVAERTASDYSDVTAELVNDAQKEISSPKGEITRNRRVSGTSASPAPGTLNPPRLAAPSFPDLPGGGSGPVAEPRIPQPMLVAPSEHQHVPRRRHQARGVHHRGVPLTRHPSLKPRSVRQARRTGSR
jgi:hypothetical protein